jgi:isocitrate dehydrogenase (NAD+)
MVEEGRDVYADPSSVIRAGAMLLSHIGYQEKADRLFAALEECAAEKSLTVTGRPDGATGAQFADYILSKI